MKKIYISVSLLASVALSNHATAQTTITAAALPQVGFIYNMISDTAKATDLPSFTVTAGSSSAQTWDYSALFNNIYTDPAAFVTPAGHPGASSFSTANMAANQNGSWVYFSSTATGLFVEGVDVVITGTTTAIMNFNPFETLIPVPYTYSNTTNNVYAAISNVTVSGIPATIHHRANRTITADAFGSLTTPAGTYSNTLRLNTHEITSDSTFVMGAFQAAYSRWDTTTTYTWMQDAADAKLMEISMDKTNPVVTKAQYLESLQFAGIQQVTSSNNQVTIYPNPAKDIINVEGLMQNAASQITITDMLGNAVYHSMDNTQHTMINVAGLAEGVYNISIISNEAVVNKRVIIAR